jgi:hypothetical protein
MEASVNMYQTVWRHVQEDWIFRKRGKALKCSETTMTRIIWKFELKDEIIYMPPLDLEIPIPA